ncbi:MAG TPA: hypothetical protein VNC39_12770, partial [Acidocella sp.]|uniref:hypothetical protein n=1 Tax=Acidocella sp. TaxID=50710 RepID=UPI002C3DFD41
MPAGNHPAGTIIEAFGNKLARLHIGITSLPYRGQNLRLDNVKHRRIGKIEATVFVLVRVLGVLAAKLAAVL